MMSKKVQRLIGAVVLLIGLVLFGFSLYIQNQVEEGKGQISSAQEKVNRGSALFSLRPETREIGKGITDSAQKKINAGEEEVAYYEDLAGKLKIGGIIVALLGIGIMFFPRKKK